MECEHCEVLALRRTGILTSFSANPGVAMPTLDGTRYHGEKKGWGSRRMGVTIIIDSRWFWIDDRWQARFWTDGNSSSCIDWHEERAKWVDGGSRQTKPGFDSRSMTGIKFGLEHCPFLYFINFSTYSTSYHGQESE